MPLVGMTPEQAAQVAAYASTGTPPVPVPAPSEAAPSFMLKDGVLSVDATMRTATQVKCVIASLTALAAHMKDS
jgi:hypothetical protein